MLPCTHGTKLHLQQCSGTSPPTAVQQQHHLHLQQCSATSTPPPEAALQVVVEGALLAVDAWAAVLDDLQETPAMCQPWLLLAPRHTDVLTA
jgi:hypothetical protein